MTATVSVRAYYQPHCPPCMEAVEQTVSSAIRDLTVTSISLVSQKRCEHDVLSAPLNLTRGDAASPTARGKPTTPPPPTSPNLDNPQPTLSGIVEEHPQGMLSGVVEEHRDPTA